MNKGELINAYASKATASQSDAKAVVEQVSEVVLATLLTGEEVTIPGVGKLKVFTRPGRNGRNPKTGESIQIPAKRVVKFTPATSFKNSINGTSDELAN